jgi:hypothetical protein
MICQFDERAKECSLRTAVQADERSRRLEPISSAAEGDGESLRVQHANPLLGSKIGVFHTPYGTRHL